MERSLNNCISSSTAFEALKPKFTRQQTEKWSASNQSSITKKQHVSTWYVDSGCSTYMIGTLELLSSYVTKEGRSMAFGGNQKEKIKGYGMIVIGEIIVNQVSYVEGLKHNLITVSQLCDNGMDVMFKIKYCIMYKADTLVEVIKPTEEEIYTFYVLKLLKLNI
ncbi:hypothetical protein OSB04_024817 [Centaurea solstitialis]|uniref:Retrovirus-related Pol polyprotein from transposon TNT 1-94-like beta-barrel domain-containing protein n=1 Tax=Centaurea solstitialis TaxID=347529 RepID=A0AA38SZ51_9ASTR|nr:hypothetical protein OSB04_024817 [Centaurea solstitialis]